jgi:hypothetical protein
LLHGRVTATIRRMNTCEAKDFLVAQAVQQASIDHIELSGLEKRMMYFTEDSDAVENPMELNEAFEAEYDSAEYERKMSRLFKRVKARLEKENSTGLATWKQSIRELQKGDHYILALSNELGSGPPQTTFRRLLWILALAVVTGIALAAMFMLGSKSFHATKPAQFPDWLKNSFWAAAIAMYFYGILPLIFKRSPFLGVKWRQIFRRVRVSRHD